VQVVEESYGSFQRPTIERKLHDERNKTKATSHM